MRRAPAAQICATLDECPGQCDLQVRWRSFNILLVQATVALLALHAAVNDLLPLLPGSELKHAPRPPPIETSRRPSVLPG